MHDSDEDRLSTMSLARIGEEMDFGDMVGAFAITSADNVPPHALQAELTALGNDGRSEEHTSELQSLMRISYAVFCLKNKNNNNKQNKTRRHTIIKILQQ